MSKVAVVPSPRVAVNSWTKGLVLAMKTAELKGLEQIDILGDNVPATASWIANPARQNSGIIVREVKTDWQSKRAVQERNDLLLSDADLVVVLGEVLTSSAKHALGRALAEHKIIVQVVGDETRKVEDAATLACAPGYEVTVPTPLSQKASGFEEFMKA